MFIAEGYSQDASEVDEDGRNTIHNDVSLESFISPASHYLLTIDQLTRLDCDIDLQDRSGKTPLHLAVQFKNLEAVSALLESGVDISLLDVDGQSAFAYTRDWSVLYPRNVNYARIFKTFLEFVYQCKLCGLHVSEIDDQIYQEYMSQPFREQMENYKCRTCRSFVSDIENEIEFEPAPNSFHLVLPHDERNVHGHARLRGYRVSEYEFQCLFCPDYAPYEIANRMQGGRAIGREFNELFQQAHRDELARLKEQKISEELTLTLGDFLSETRAVAAYPYMIPEQRQVIDRFFQSRRDLRVNFNLFASLLLLQYGKACKRVTLLKEATLSLDTLTSANWPYLCSKGVFGYLSNADLGNLVASVHFHSTK